ncbi:hypothetical protein ACH5RR_034869 [Cinchona calisaya]|uniref:Uncharacterized protein n=1 Tax=Cinchona calisaya TaxID=153742 RepID=A0ABD2YDC1_9GENT
MKVKDTNEGLVRVGVAMLVARQRSINTIAAAQEIFVEANIVESKHQGFAVAGVEETEAAATLGFNDAATRGGAEATAAAGDSPSAADTTIDKNETPYHAVVAMAPKVDNNDAAIRLSHCSNPELSSAALGSKIKPFVAAVMGKNSTSIA